jgi:hypothetical protein
MVNVPSLTPTTSRSPTRKVDRNRPSLALSATTGLLRGAPSSASQEPGA